MKPTDKPAPPYANGRSSLTMYRSVLKAVKPSQLPANITQLNPKKAVRMTIKMGNNGLFIGLRGLGEDVPFFQ